MRARGLSAQQWQQIEELFLKAVEMPAGERQAFLRLECGADERLLREVESLLRYESGGEERIEEALRSAAQSVAGPGVEAGTRIGPYQVQRLLGHGGMGSVYLARRDDRQYDKLVAIKVVPPGLIDPGMVERFRQERQILAGLEHPYIARLLDGGATDGGAPYLVMEYVEGAPIDEWCKARSLNVDERCELFMKVCEAVGYAHRKLVVHRDLKPGNILVTADGTPRLLDFGIAKLLPGDGDAAQAGQTLAPAMTPDYASPEQVRGEAATTATDVYGLGGVLYRLLSGARPHPMKTRTPGEMERVICEVTPARPSAVATWGASRRLEGDLDNIVLMALRKEPERRYHSAEQLRDDIRRHLVGLPVAAREDTLGYRAGKFLRRNRLGVTAAALAALGLAVGAGVAVWQARQAEQARISAERATAVAVRERGQAEQARADALTALQEAGRSRERARREAVQAGVARGVAEARLGQLVRLADESMGGVYTAIERIPGAMEARQQVTGTTLRYLADLEKEAGSDARVRRVIALTYERTGDVQGLPDRANLGGYREALLSYEKSRGLLMGLVKQGENDRALRVRWAGLQFKIGRVLQAMGQVREALPQLRTGLALIQALTAEPRATSEDWAQRMVLAEAVAKCYLLIDPEKAIVPLNDQLASLEKLKQMKAGDDVVLVQMASAYSTRARALSRFGRETEAIDDYRRCLALREGLAERHPSDASALRNLMITYGSLGDHLGSPLQGNLDGAATAMSYYDKARQVAERMVAADRSNATARSDLAAVLMRMGVVEPSPQRSLDYLRQAAALDEEGLARDGRVEQSRRNLSVAREFIGERLARLGQLDEAAREYARSLELARAVLKTNAKDISAMITILEVYGGLMGIEGRRGGSAGVERLAGEARSLAAAYLAGTDRLALGHMPARVEAWAGRAYAALAEGGDRRLWAKAADALARSRTAWNGATETSRKRFARELDDDDRLLARCRRESAAQGQ